MANNIITIYKSSIQEAVSPGQTVIRGDNLQFDTVTERWYFGNGLIPEGYQPGGGLKPKGNNSAGNLDGSWVCMGYSDVEVLPGRPIIATITWRGLFKTIGNTSVVESASIRETTYEALGSIPSAPTTAARPARVHDVIPGLLCRGIFGTHQPRPVITATGVSQGNGSGFQLPAAPAQITVWGAVETYNHPYGWLPYSWQQEEPVPGFFLVSAEFRYVHKVTFG